MRTLLSLFAALSACAGPGVKPEHPDRTGTFAPDEAEGDGPQDEAESEDDGDSETEEETEEEDDQDDQDGTPKDPVNPEECDGVDNDRDGEVDEGFEDTDGDGIADCVDTEECDGLDNDGDGLIDEGFDTDHDGTADCLETIYDVEFHVTVDDTWDGSIDGDAIGASGGWNHVDSFEWELSSGPHVITVHGEDLGEAISAFLASVIVDGEPVFLTGDGSWAMRSDGSEPGWMSAGFSDAHWDSPVPCVDTTPWGDWSGLPHDHGAQWVWFDPSGDCRTPSSWREGWFRLEFDLP
jgi:hypothetical protein